MRAFGMGLSAFLFVSVAASAQAGLVADGPATQLHTTPKISTELSADIPLRNLVSPSMQWSQLEIDSLKTDGISAGLELTDATEMAVKSDLIRSFNVAEIETTAPPQPDKYRPVVYLLMLLAGFTMWVGLSFQRRY